MMLVSCYRNMYHFTRSDLEWFSIYNKNDMVYFDCDSIKDMLVITYKKNCDRESKWVKNEGELL